EGFALSARPFDLDGISLRFLAQTKGCDKFALREITRTAANHLHLLFAARSYSDHCTNSVAIGLGAGQRYSQAAIGHAVVVKKICAATVGVHKQVENAFVEQVGISRAPRAFWRGKCGP